MDSDWGAAASSNFLAQAAIEGIEVIEEKYKSDETDFSSIITKVKLSDPDVLVVMDQGVPVSAELALPALPADTGRSNFPPEPESQ